MLSYYGSYYVIQNAVSYINDVVCLDKE
jgi:hypothetical protein